MVHVKIMFGGLTEATRHSNHTMDVSSENYMNTIHDLIRHRLNIDEMLAIDILMQNPQHGPRALVRLSSPFCDNMELGTALMNFDENVHDDVILGRETLRITIQTRSGAYRSPVLQYVQNAPAPPPISAPRFVPAVSEQSMRHRPYI